MYNFPKIDLHFHLDGSFRYETVWQLAQEQGVEMPTETLEEYKQWVYSKTHSGTVNEYLTVFDSPLSVMQDYDSLVRVTKEAIIDQEARGLAYVEIRFAPQLHTQKGMTQDEAVQAVLEGRRQALEECHSIKVGILTCMMSVGPETVNWNANEETIEVCHKYLGHGVVGIDLAGAEGIVPLSNFGPLFKKAREYHIPITCHAGDSQGPDTVLAAMDFGATRLGHGHHIYNSPTLCELAIQMHITCEVCPTSNIQCCTQPSYEEHPLKKLYDMGVPVTVNTDNTTLSDVTLDDEYDHCINEMGFTVKDLIKMNLNALECAFLAEEEKEPIRKQLQEALKA